MDRYVCGECGVVVGDGAIHITWHAAPSSDDAVVDFLASIDPQALTQVALANTSMGVDPARAILTALIQLAEQR